VGIFDALTLVFTLLITAATAIIFGLLPAWQASNPALGRDLAESSRVSGTGPRHQLRRSILLTLTGLVLGLIGALALTRVLERLLYEIKPHDPWTFGVVMIVLSFVALVACWLPAWRATRIEPMEALRDY
jgi:ABC-type antimicrobial peptide transport system permease subunit